MHIRLLALVVPLAAASACGSGGGDSRDEPAPAPAVAAIDAAPPRPAVAYVLVGAAGLRVGGSPFSRVAAAGLVPPAELEANVRELLGPEPPTGAQVLLAADGAATADKVIDAARMLAALHPHLAVASPSGEPT